MSKKTGNRKKTTDDNHSSYDSEGSSTNESADVDVVSPSNKSSNANAVRPRLPRRSQQNKKDADASTETPRDNEFPNKAQIQSSDISDDDSNLRNNSGVVDESDPLNDNEQQVAHNDGLLPSDHNRASSNDESKIGDPQHEKPNTKQPKMSANTAADHENQHESYPQGKNIQEASPKHSDSDDVIMDDQNQQDAHRQTTGTTCFSHHHDVDQPSTTSKIHKRKPDDVCTSHSACRFRTDKKWLDLQFHDDDTIKKPDELQNEIEDPPGEIDETVLDRIQGSMIGMALGDALGAHVEFRPNQYLVQNPVTDLKAGGTWGLEKGQFTDDTSMALCLANSLVARQDFIPYDQLVRYKWWYKSGYMSSTGHCFDIGAATRQSIVEFERRQKKFAKQYGIPPKEMDSLSDPELLAKFDVYCSEEEVAGNGALMRLAPVPLFFFRSPEKAIEFSGFSGQITHGDVKARDACRYYGALIAAAVGGCSKEKLLDNEFYSRNKKYFGNEELHPDVELIAEGSYKRRRGYKDGIRGKGYILSALEAALWAFWSDENSFEKGALAAVNLGDDTDTTAAIYGQLAGACYGYKNLPPHWVKDVYAHKFMEQLSKWIVHEGEQWHESFKSK